MANDHQKTEVSIIRIESSFVNDHIIDTYCILLADSTKLDPTTCHYITKMFHRIFVKHQAEPLFYKVSND